MNLGRGIDILPAMYLSRPVVLLTVVSFGAAFGCGGGGSSQGGEGQPCYPNGTCDTGLTCAEGSQLCVDLGGEGDGSGGGGNGSGGDSGEGSGGSPDTGELLEECLGCGADACEDESSACGDASGCEEALECWLECAGDTSCTNACDVSELDADGVTALGDYFGCAAEECVDECVDAFVETGSGGSTGSGGADNSGTGGDDNSGSGGEGNSGTGGDGGGSGGAGTGGSAPVEGELILNGGFEEGDLYWNLDLNAGSDGTYSDDGELCVNNLGYDLLSFSLGFPSSPTDAFTLEGDVSYTFSFEAQGYAEIEAKVGLSVEPYTEVDSNTDTVNSSDFQTFAYLISTAATTESVGLVLNVTVDSYSFVCFDNVSFAPN